MTDKDYKILTKCQNYWNNTVQSQAWRQWFFTAVKSEKYKSGDFYAGDKTWAQMNSAEFEAEMMSHLNASNTPYTPPIDAKLSVNLIDPYINSLVGEQLKTKTSVSVRAGEFSPNKNDDISPVGASEEELALYVQAYNAQLYRTYEKCDVVYYQGRSLEDMLTYGLGAGFFDVVNGQFVYYRVNPLYVVPDLRDETLGFDDSEFVAQLIPTATKKAIKLFPKLKNMVNGDDGYNLQFISPAYLMMMAGPDDVLSNGSTVFIKMVEWKELETSYSGIASNGREFTVFDEEIAEKFVFDKKKIIETESERIHRAYYAGGQLLYYKALDFAQPRDQFSLVLSCLSKKSSYNGFYIPKSLVENLLDIHDAFLVSLSKATYLSFSKKIAIDPTSLKGSFSNGETFDERGVKGEIASPNTVLFLENPGQSLVDFSHHQQINVHENLAEGFMRVADRASGINREQQGLPTNAYTGIAIKERQIQSITSNLYAFNEFENFKRKVGRLFIQTLQMITLGQVDIFYPAHPKKGGYIPLNIQKDDNVLMDINFLPLDVYIEETPYYLSSKEEQMQMLTNLLQSPISSILIQSPSLMQKLPIPIDPEIAQELSMIFQAQQQAAAGVSNQNPVQNVEQTAPQGMM